MYKYLYLDKENKLKVGNNYEEVKAAAINEKEIYRVIQNEEFENLLKKLQDKEEILERYYNKVKKNGRSLTGVEWELGTKVTMIKLNFAEGNGERYWIETKYPANMYITKIQEKIKGKSVKEFFPELLNPEKYMIMGAELRNSDFWTIEIKKIK